MLALSCEAKFFIHSFGQMIEALFFFSPKMQNWNKEDVGNCLKFLFWIDLGFLSLKENLIYLVEENLIYLVHLGIGIEALYRLHCKMFGGFSQKGPPIWGVGNTLRRIWVGFFKKYFVSPFGLKDTRLCDLRVCLLC